MRRNLFQFVYTLVLILACCVYTVVGFFDPITIGIGAGSLLGYGVFKDRIYCSFTECCNDYYIPGNISSLKQKLEDNLYGQHIVIKQLIPALEAHFNPHTKSKKPLVISFHGTPGTGKNYVSDMIANTLYTNGLTSKYVHKYLGRADFPLASQAEIYKERINKEVREAITDCPRSLFIFDEVDKMPPGVFESLTSLVDHNAVVEKQDYTKAIFIFLSNTAGVHISDRLGKIIKDGTIRENTKLSDFEQILEVAAYNMGGGMQKTSLIEAHVIDHFIPFLPLEKSHVIKCIVAEFLRWGKSPSPEQVEKIIQNVVIYDRNHGLFATSGCKTLEKKVAVEVMSK